MRSASMDEETGRYGALSQLSEVLDDLKSESMDAICFFRNVDAFRKKEDRNVFELQSYWQKLIQLKLNREKSFYKKFFYTRQIPEPEKPYVENPFYFHDLSHSFEDNGYGDHYLYGLYAGWPQVLMVDKQAYFSHNENEFHKLSIERHLSHKNSLLSSASMTQIVCRLDRNTTPSLLNILRPKDPMIRRRMLERHAVCTTLRKDHNKEASKPYVASSNLPRQYPITFDETKPFPKSLRELALKQHHERMMIAPHLKVTPLIPKFHDLSECPSIFPRSRKIKIHQHRVDAETQTTADLLIQDITRNLPLESRLEMDAMKELYLTVLERKRIPLCNYQYSVFFYGARPEHQPRGFYDIQPKVESPWLSKMIKNGKFTRKYYLENFKTNFNPPSNPVLPPAATKMPKPKGGKTPKHK